MENQRQKQRQKGQEKVLFSCALFPLSLWISRHNKDEDIPQYEQTVVWIDESEIQNQLLQPNNFLFSFRSVMDRPLIEPVCQGPLHTIRIH